MGNICRSPTAEGCMRHHVQQQDVAHLFEIDSAGTIGYHTGEAPDPRSQQYALQQGIDLSKQHARKVHDKDFKSFDHIIAMDSDNLNKLKRTQPKLSTAKISLLTDWLNESEFVDVPDPYYGSGNGFKTVFDLVNTATLSLFEQLKS
jgi:protein-tyrosine phosphatase